MTGTQLSRMQIPRDPLASAPLEAGLACVKGLGGLSATGRAMGCWGWTHPV